MVPVYRRTMGKLFVRVRGKEGRSDAVLSELRAKSKRRALRHFKGKEIRHRVVHKDATSIEFAFMRRTGKPVYFRWRRVETPPKVQAAKSHQTTKVATTKRA